MSSTIEAKIKKIKLLIFDIDGVLADGSIILGSGGGEYKIFDVQDGLGITLARRAGLKVGIITGRKSEAVERRASELKIDAIYQSAFIKIRAFRRMLAELNVNEEAVCYVGDDLLDIPVMKRAGFAVAVPAAREEVINLADYVTLAPGGKGAVREVVELILKTQGRYSETVQELLKETEEQPEEV
ncbi:MAG TPA: HAD-IIIA family hydrolase [bacterium]|nr:HAD-IIIA family hydrolase [bacterium]